MTSQLVKKNRTDTRKRKGYKGKAWYDNALLRFLTPLGSGKSGLRRTGDTTGLLMSLASMPWPFKEGGRVRGVGKATHGYGRAMRKK
jgi:hypothetical protein